jgi:hypothetical protein
MPNKKDWGVISLRMIYERVLSCFDKLSMIGINPFALS